MIDDISQYMTLSQAAKYLGYAYNTYLRTLCQAGSIPGAEKDGKLWYIPREWVLAEKAKTPTGQGARGQSRN